MAIPAAIFIKKFSYRSGILIGLALYAIGCLLFIPSGMSLSFAPFLAAYLIMTCGLSFLETTANPYILSMGDDATATRRLNLAQAFNPMGSIVGMFVASMFILVNLDSTTEDARRALLATSDGKPVYTQVVSQQAEKAQSLETMIASSGWEKSKKLLKKGKEDAQALAQTLSILADPKLAQAEGISKAIAEQPSDNKFAAAAKAVAVVLQLRDKIKPTEAENQRDALFFGPGGLELAKMLGKENTLLVDNNAFGAAKSSIAAALPVAQSLSAQFAALYESSLHAGEKSVDSAQISVLIAQIRTNLHAAQKELSGIPSATFTSYSAESAARFKEIQKSDLDIVVGPYAIMGVVLIIVLVLFAWKLPKAAASEGDNQLHLGATLGRLFKNGRYMEGVIAQTFYVGAQIMCWTFIIQYAELELGVSKATAQNCNILAMIIFVSSRFVCTFLLHYIQPGALLALLALGGLLFTAGTIFIHGYAGLYCLIGVSACMSLMFPTIYGIALDGLGDDAKLGSAGLILAIGGGCLMPPLQGAIIDMPPIDLGFMELASVRASFALPLICFAVIAIYGFRTYSHHKKLALA